MSHITITIAGPTGSGKSTIAALITQALEGKIVHGMEEDTEFESRDAMLRIINANGEDRLTAINYKTTVLLRQVQTKNI